MTGGHETGKKRTDEDFMKDGEIGCLIVEVNFNLTAFMSMSMLCMVVFILLLPFIFFIFLCLVVERKSCSWNVSPPRET